MENKLHIQEILGGLDLGTPFEKVKNGYYVDALNVGFKGYGRKMGDLHPSPGMQPMNFVFRQRTQDPQYDSPDYRLTLMCERMAAFNDADIYASYDFGTVSVLLGEALYDPKNGTPPSYALYLYTVKLNNNYSRTSSGGVVEGDIARYEVCEYFRFPKPLSSYAGISMTGKMNDGRPTLYMTVPNMGMYAISIADEITPSLTDLQNNMIDIKIGVEDYISAPSHIPPGLSVYFFRLISRDANGDREIARSCFSEPIHIPYSYQSEEIGPVNREFQKTDFVPEDKASIKSYIQVKLNVPPMTSDEGAWFDYNEGNKLQIFAVRMMSATGLVVNEKYPYARIEMIGEVSPSFDDKHSCTIVDGVSVYRFPQGIDMEDMIYQARSYVLFQCANTISVKEGVFYAGGVYDVTKKHTDNYDARVWQFNLDNKVKDYNGAVYTLDRLQNMSFDSTFNIDYVQCDLVNNWYDYHSKVKTTDYCMHAYIRETDTKAIHGASGPNVRIEFATGAMHSGGVCPETDNINDYDRIQNDATAPTGSKATMGDPHYAFSTIARCINAPNYDVGAPRDSSHWWNTNIDNKTGCIKALQYKISSPSASETYTEFTQNYKYVNGLYLITDALLCLKNETRPQISLISLTNISPPEHFPITNGGNKSVIRIALDETSLLHEYLVLRRVDGILARNFFTIGLAKIDSQGHEVFSNSYSITWNNTGQYWENTERKLTAIGDPSLGVSAFITTEPLTFKVTDILFSTAIKGPPIVVYSYDGADDANANKAWADTNIQYQGEGPVLIQRADIQSYANPRYATNFRCLQHDSVYYLACKLVYRDGSVSELLPMGCVRTPSGTNPEFPLFEDHVAIDDPAAIQHVYNPSSADTAAIKFTMKQFTEIKFHPLYMYVEFSFLPVGVKEVHVLYQLRDGTHMNIKATGVFHQAHKPLSVYGKREINMVYGDLNIGDHFIYEGEKYIKGYDDEHLDIDETVGVTIEGLKQKYYDEGGKYSLSPLPGLGSQQYFYGGAISTPSTDDHNCLGSEPSGPNKRSKEWEDSNSSRSAALISPIFINTPGERDYSLGVYKFHSSAVAVLGVASGSVAHRYTSRVVQTNMSNNKKMFVFHAPEIDIVDTEGKSIAPVRIDGGGTSHVCVQGILWSIFPAGYNRSLLSAAYSELNDGFNKFFNMEGSTWRGLPSMIPTFGPDLYVTWAKMYPFHIENGMDHANTLYDSLYITEDYRTNRTQMVYTGDTHENSRICIGSTLQMQHFNPLLFGNWGDPEKIMTSKHQTFNDPFSAALQMLGIDNLLHHLHTLEDTNEIVAVLTQLNASLPVELRALTNPMASAVDTMRGLLDHLMFYIWGPYLPEGLHFGNVGDFLTHLHFNENSQVFRPNKGGLPPRTIKLFIYSDKTQQSDAITKNIIVDGTLMCMAKNLRVIDVGGFDRIAKDDMSFQYSYLWPCSTEKRVYSENPTPFKSNFDVIHLDNGMDFVNLCPMWSARMTSLSGLTHKYMPSTSVYSGSDKCRMHGQVIGHSRSNTNSFPIPAAIKDSVMVPFSDHGLTVDIDHASNPHTEILYDFKATSSSAWFSIGVLESLKNDTVVDVIYPSKQNSVFPDVAYGNYTGLASAWKPTRYMHSPLDVFPTDPVYQVGWPDYQLFVEDIMTYWDSIHHWCGYNSMDMWIGPNHHGYGGRVALFTAENALMPPKTSFPAFMRDDNKQFGITHTPTSVTANLIEYCAREAINKRVVTQDSGAALNRDYGVYIKDRRLSQPSNSNRTQKPLNHKNIAAALNQGVNAAFGTIRGPASGYESHDFNEKQFVTAGVLQVEPLSVEAKGFIHNFDTFVGIYKKLYTHAFYPTNEVCDEESMPSSPTIMMFPYEGRINVDYMNCIDDILYGEQPSGVNNKRQTLLRNYTFKTGGQPYTQKTDMYGYNMVYSGNLCWEQNEYIDRDTTQEALSRVYFTTFQPDGRNIRPFRPFDYLELNLENGEVTNLQSFGENLFILQQEGTAITTPKMPQLAVSSNGENSKLQFISPIGNTGQDTRYDVFAGRYTYLSHRFGTRDRNHRAVAAGADGVYWIDETNRTFCRFYDGKLEQMEAINAWVDDLGVSIRKFFAIHENQIILTSPTNMTPRGALGELVLTPFVKEGQTPTPITAMNKNTLLYDEDNGAFASFLTMTGTTSVSARLEVLRIGRHTVSITGINHNLPCMLKDKTGVVYPLYNNDWGSSVTCYVNGEEGTLVDKEFTGVITQNKCALDRDRVVETGIYGQNIDGKDKCLRSFAQAYHYKVLHAFSFPPYDVSNVNQWQDELIRKRKVVPMGPIAQNATGEQIFFSPQTAGSRWGSKMSFAIGTEAFGQPFTGLGLFVKQGYQTFAHMSIDERGNIRRVKDQNMVYPFNKRHRGYFSAFGVSYSPIDLF
jgi:hypothetical protein